MRDCCLVNHCPICHGDRDKDDFVCLCHNPEIQAIQREAQAKIDALATRS